MLEASGNLILKTLSAKFKHFFKGMVTFTMDCP